MTALVTERAQIAARRWQGGPGDGHVAVPLPAVAAARASELVLTVPTLLRDAAHVQALDALAGDWAATTDGRHLLSWSARQPQDPRGGKCHLHTTGDFARFATADPRAPALLRAVLARLRCVGTAAERRLLAGFAAPLHTTGRARCSSPSPHAATPPVDGPQLSIGVFATVEHSAPDPGARGRSARVGWAATSGRDQARPIAK